MSDQVEVTEIPVSAIPNQEFSIVLGGQNCVIGLRQIAENLFMDLTVDDEVIFTGRICQNDFPVNLYRSRFFSGYLFFEDQLGSEKPEYSGLNDRWKLYYIPEEDDE